MYNTQYKYTSIAVVVINEFIHSLGTFEDMHILIRLNTVVQLTYWKHAQYNKHLMTLLYLGR